VSARLPPNSAARRIFIALGSNIGDRLSHFNRSISLLQAYGLTLVQTGRIYESEPMYVEDQDRFMNTAIEVRGSMDAMAVLRVLKRVEREVGRRKTFTNGPRVVDLDLVYYGEEVVQIGERGDVEDADGVGWLQVPHWGLGEREFVLRPLAE
jgi:dihydroneopterin aldolase/2-amino-4-hydroxy-6-hydroxymethyldihydropteridine diphosphokinase/dihydropteroate synthase